MSLTITSNTVLDEEFRVTQSGTSDDNDVASSSFITTAVTSLSLTTLSGVTGFPQYAENTSFVSTLDPITDWYLTLSSNGVGTTRFVGGNEIFLYSTSDPDIVVGRVGTATTADPNGAVALIIGIDDSSVSSPILWMAQYAPLVDSTLNKVDANDQLNLSGLVSLGATYATSTEIPFENFAGVKSGQDAFAPVASTLSGAPDVELLITGFSTAGVGTVNVSTTGLGTNAQHVDPNESIRVDIVAGLDTSGALDSTFVHDASHISYSGHVNVSYAEFSIAQLNPTGTPATASIFAYQDDNAGGTSFDYQGAAFPTNAISDPGTAVQIDADDVIIMDSAGNNITAAFKATAGNSIVADGMGVKITGLLKDEQLAFTTDNIPFDRFIITNTLSGKGPSTFDVGAIEVKTITFGSSDETVALGSHLIFQDDGPVIGLASGATVPTLQVYDGTLGTDPHDNFAGLFTTPDYGADGAGSHSYILGLKNNGTNVISGLSDTATGENIVLNYDSGTNRIIGTTVTTSQEAFVISVNSSGEVTLNQERAIKHSNTSSSSETTGMASDLVTLTLTLTDSEANSHNDSASATANIGAAFVFTDDGPTLTPQAAGSLTPNNLVVGNVTSGSTASDSSSYGLAPGGDGSGGYTIVGPADGSGDFQWTYTDNTHTSIVETYKGSSLFTLTLNPATGGYTVTMSRTIPSTPLPLDANNIKAGGPVGSIDVGTIGTSEFVLITGAAPPGASSAVNASNGNVGVGNGNLDQGEALTFSLYTDSTNTTLIPIHGMDIGTKTAQNAVYHVTGIVHGTNAVIDLGTIPVGKNGTIHVDAGNVFLDSITVAETSGSAIKIGLSGITLLTPPGDYTLPFSVQLADRDGDIAPQSFTVSIDGDNSGTITNPISGLAAINTSSEMLSMTTSLGGSTPVHHQDYFLV